MNNFEKYNKLHNEVMKRLEDGEIAVEYAKELNDLAFEKYIGFDESRVTTESVKDIINKIRAGITNFKLKDIEYQSTDIPKLDATTQAKVDEAISLITSMRKDIKAFIEPIITKYNTDHKLSKTCIKYGNDNIVECHKVLKKDNLKRHEILVCATFVTIDKSASKLDDTIFNKFINDITDAVFTETNYKHIKPNTKQKDLILPGFGTDADKEIHTIEWGKAIPFKTMPKP